jgi:putative thioredoxin
MRLFPNALEKTMGQHAYDVSSADFSAKVLARSNEVPVLVDFWAEWCGPCRMLKPVLEKLADEYGGQFQLAKVNSDLCPDLAQRYAIRSIPNVKAFVGGEVVDEFLGALPERGVREFITRILPSGAEKMRREAAALNAAGRFDAAIALLRDALAAEPRNESVLLDLAEALIAAGNWPEAGELVRRAGDYPRDELRAKRLAAHCEFAAQAAAAGEPVALQRKLDGAADDVDTRLQLAARWMMEHRHAEALEQLLDAVRRARRSGNPAPRRTMLQAFALLGNDHPLVGQYRRELASLLN